MFKNLSIFQRLVISYLVLSWLMLILTSIIYYQTFKTALLTRTLEQLSSINMLKRIQIEEYFNKNTNASIHDPHIHFVLREITGIGQTGESYLVDSTYKMRSNSRFFPDKTPEKILVKTQSSEMVFSKGESKLLCYDYRNIPVLSVGRIVEHYHQNDLAIITEIDESEAMKPVFIIRNYIVIVVFLFSVVIVIITLIFAQKLSKPILIIRNFIEDLALGKIPKHQGIHFDFKELEEINKSIQLLIMRILTTSKFAYETGSGNFHASFSPASNADILGNALIQMRDKLKELSEQQLSSQRQRALALLEGQEKERERISRELHDGVGQLLTGIKLMMASENILFEKKQEINELLAETIQEIRRISQSVMPPALTGLGLKAALNNLCKIMSSKDNIEIEIEYELPNGSPADFESRICLYRIAQEALNNMIKHAMASRCLVQVFEDNHKIIMKISDNGIGFIQSDRINTGNGLQNMQERAAMLNGSCRISSNPEKGTQIVVEIPIPELGSNMDNIAL